MRKYNELLTLVYFMDRGVDYDIHELMEIKGYNSYQIMEHLELLKQQELIGYDNYLLSITEKGKRVLIANDAINFTLDPIDNALKGTRKSKAIQLDEPYVPKNF